MRWGSGTWTLIDLISLTPALSRAGEGVACAFSASWKHLDGTAESGYAYQMTASAIALRRYRPDDLEQTVAVWRRSKRAAFPYVEVQQRYTLEDDTGHFRSVIAVLCEVWLAEVDGRIAGLLAQRGELIDQLFVDVDCQGRGVGTALLRAAMLRSPNRLRLFTFQRNAGARAFYERHGFRALCFGISAPPENEPDVEYEWPAL